MGIRAATCNFQQTTIEGREKKKKKKENKRSGGQLSI